MAVVHRYIGILTVGVVFFRTPGVFHSKDSFPSMFHPRLLETFSGVVPVGMFAAEARRELWAHPSILHPTAEDETSRGRNPENGRHWDFGRRRRHRQSGFQHTDRPRPSSPELFNKQDCSVQRFPVIAWSYPIFFLGACKKCGVPAGSKIWNTCCMCWNNTRSVSISDGACTEVLPW